MPIVMNTDGGTRSNPGPGAWGVVITTPTKGKFKLSGFLEHTTNNEAEYSALIEGLQWIQENDFTLENVIIRTDSELMSRQISGQYEVRKETLLPFWALASALIEDLRSKGVTVTIQEIKREQNTEADALCNAVMDEHGVVSNKRKRNEGE